MKILKVTLQNIMLDKKDAYPSETLWPDPLCMFTPKEQMLAWFILNPAHTT